MADPSLSKTLLLLPVLAGTLVFSCLQAQLKHELSLDLKPAGFWTKTKPLALLGIQANHRFWDFSTSQTVGPNSYTSYWFGFSEDP